MKLEDLYKAIIPSYILLLLVMAFSCTETSTKEIVKVEYRDTCLSKIDTVFIEGIQAPPSEVIIRDTVYLLRYELLTVKDDAVIASYKHIDSLGAEIKLIDYYYTVAEFLKGVEGVGKP
jgi:hypothetical protein